jgi:hypothetical protein
VDFVVIEEDDFVVEELPATVVFVVVEFNPPVEGGVEISPADVEVEKVEFVVPSLEYSVELDIVVASLVEVDEVSPPTISVAIGVVLLPSFTVLNNVVEEAVLSLTSTARVELDSP